MRRSALSRQLALAAGWVLTAAAVGALSPVDLRAAAPQNPQLLQGSVADAATLEVIPGAAVTLITTGSVTESGPDGSFGFPETTLGRVSLRIESPGYQTTFWEGDVVAGSAVPIEVLLSRPQAPGTLRVLVRSTDSGEPLAGATVSIPDLGISAATDQAGAVVLPDMRPGSFLVTASSLGYASLTSLVGVGEASVALEMVLPSVPIGLEPVVVEAETDFNARLDGVGFYERRGQGIGAFFDKADIERANPGIPSDLVRFLPGVERSTDDLSGAPIYTVDSRRGFAGFEPVGTLRTGEPIMPDCQMPVFVDGTLYGHFGMMDTLPVESIEAIEVYSGVSRIPIEFNVPDRSCGLMLVWTTGADIPPPPAPAAASAREIREVQLGDEVRFASALASGRFVVADAGPSGLTLRADDASEPIQVPASAMSDIEVSLGRSTSITRGMQIGGMGGAAVGAIVYLSCNMPHFGCLGGGSPGAAALMTMGLGSLVGLLFSLASDEVWAGSRLPLGP